MSRTRQYAQLLSNLARSYRVYLVKKLLNVYFTHRKVQYGEPRLICHPPFQDTLVTGPPPHLPSPPLPSLPSPLYHLPPSLPYPPLPPSPLLPPSLSSDMKLRVLHEEKRKVVSDYNTVLNRVI